MIGMISAQIVAVLAVGGSIFYGMAHLSHRDVPDGVRSRLEGALVPAALRRSSSLAVLQRRTAENGPNEAKSTSDEAKDPSYTGTVKINEKSARQENNQRSRRLRASSLPHPRPVVARSRAHQAYAGRRARPVRWVARRQRWPGFAERYAPRIAYTPWW